MTAGPRLLVVNADDVGLTEGICRAVARGHTDGVVTSMSVLAVGPAFDTAAKLAGDHERLSLGAHLAMVGEDPPLLSPREIPTLVDARGRFPLSYRTVVARGLAGRLDPADVRREFAAQLERIRGIGVPVSHLDTHQHTHLWPAVAAAVCDLAREHGIRAVRLPSSHRRHPVTAGVQVLGRSLRRRIEAAGLIHPDGYAGLDEAGRLDHARFTAALDRFVAGGVRRAEINTHPGVAGDPDLDRFAWRYDWSGELDLLLAASTRRVVDERGFRLASYAELAQQADGRSA